jgi:hypothetical protein
MNRWQCAYVGAAIGIGGHIQIEGKYRLRIRAKDSKLLENIQKYSGKGTVSHTRSLSTYELNIFGKNAVVDILVACAEFIGEKQQILLDINTGTLDANVAKLLDKCQKDIRHKQQK